MRDLDLISDLAKIIIFTILLGIVAGIGQYDILQKDKEIKRLRADSIRQELRYKLLQRDIMIIEHKKHCN